MEEKQAVKHFHSPPLTHGLAQHRHAVSLAAATVSLHLPKGQLKQLVLSSADGHSSTCIHGDPNDGSYLAGSWAHAHDTKKYVEAIHDQMVML